MTARRPIAALAAALASAILAACGPGGGGASGDDGPLVVATTTQLADIARNVAGDLARVEQILQPSADPHAYEPRPSDVKAVAAAAVVLRSGGAVDAWLDGVLANAGSRASTLTVLDALDADASGAAVADDPHWWHDPRAAITAVGLVADALAVVDPPRGAGYRDRARRYRARLRVLDRAIAACVDAVAPARRKLVTDHDALGRFADRYGIEVVATVVPGRSTQAQASAGEIARLVRTIRSTGVTTVFTARSGNPKLARAVAREAGAKLGPPLYVDALGPPASPGATYLGAMRFNASAIVDGLAPGDRRCQL